MTSKYVKCLLPILLILLFADTASALPTTTHDKLQGEMYVSSTANWPSKYSINNFNVPDGTVVFARYYIGVWTASTAYDLDSMSTTFNGHELPIHPSYYSSEMGVTWVPFDVTDYVNPGEVNTATVNSAAWGDGRQYGSTLVVVLKNESKPQIEYWVAEGLDWMHYGDFLGYEVNNSTTYFNGGIDQADVQNASLYSTHLTGFNYEDLNGKSLSSASESVRGEYFYYLRWDNVTGSLVPENQTVLVSRGNAAYSSVVFHALSIEYKNPDLVPVKLTPSLVSANIENNMTAIIENRGNKDSPAFNISLIVDGVVVDTQPISGLTIGSSMTVNLHWTPDGSIDAYSLTVITDPENILVESDESNNKLKVLVGTKSASAPIADFSGTPTSGDSPFSVTFTDLSTNSPTSWAWDFENDGRVDSTDQNPVHNYVSIGNYTVNLTVINAGGSDSKVKTEYIVVRPLVADFTATPISGRVPFIVEFTDTSAGSPTSWVWDFGDGTNTTGQNVSHTYTSIGTYTVNLTVTNTGGTNSTEKADYITVMDTLAPVADFSGTPTSGNVWLTVNFTDQSANAPISWLWDFGDGTTETTQNPSHTYKRASTYSVNLTATNAAGTNSTVKTDYITVLAIPGPVWTAKSEWNLPYVGLNAAPALADLDGDGDYDLLVGAIGTSTGTVFGYENTGTKSNPIWTAKSEWTITGLRNAPMPSLADLDGDGDYDLMIGVNNGKCYGYENTGNATSPVWTAKSTWNAPYDSGDFASASLADLDDDGDYDLLMGGSKIDYLTTCENTGTVTSPVWTVKSAWNTLSFGRYSAATLADLDGDGDYDLLAGSEYSLILAYENTGTANSPVWTQQIIWSLPSIGTYAHPALADLDSDGDCDLLIGLYNGAFYAYENIASSAVAKPDLTITTISPPSRIVANEPCTIVAIINNTGTGNVDAFNVNLSVNGTVVETQSISGIITGSNTLVNFSWTPEVAGDYNLTVTADSDNGIAESDEANNALTITVTASAASEIPDTTKPVIDSVVLFPANTTAGATIKFSVNATDNKEVTEVTAGDIKLIKTDGIWKGSITAPALVGSYSLSINATDAAGNAAEISVPYRVVQLSGGANIAVSPRSSSVVAGNNTTLNLKVKNTQNIDDTFKVRISVSELPASYQADLSWFNWAEKIVSLRAGEEVLIPVKVTVPEGTAAGRKLFRANVKSETSSITGFDTGYLTIA